MLKVPVIGIIFWLALGFSGGWWASSLYGDKVPLPTQVVQLPTPPAPPPVVATGPAYLQSLNNYRLAQQANIPDTDQITAQRERILSYAEKLVDDDSDEAKRLLDEFLDIEEYDARALYLKARAAFRNGDYPEALDIMLELKILPQAEVNAKDINNLLDSITSTYAAELKQLERTDDLLNLYQRMALAVTEDRQYYYKLAEVQYQLNLYYDAINSLNYSLYDPIWGARSRELLQKAQQYINLEEGEQVSLERDGSHFIVNARVNYFGNVKLLIDTGASLSALRPEIARSLGIDFDEEETVVVQVAGGTFNAPLITLESLALNDVEAGNIGAHIIEIGPNVGVDGLLGMNFLGRFRFFIDQERELLFLGEK